MPKLIGANGGAMRGLRGCRRVGGIVALLLSAAALPATATAMEGARSPYLPGYRDFMTGYLPAPGVLVRQDVYAYKGSEHSTIPQGKLDTSYSALTNILGVTVVFPFEIFGGRYGFAVHGVYSHLEASQTVGNLPAFSRSGGLSAFNDFTITPVILGWDAGNLHWNVAATVWLPIGSYDKNRFVNTGKNAWAVAPQFGVTYFNPASGWEISGALGYVASWKNPDTNYRSGKIVHADFAIGKMLAPAFEVGVLGYFAQQVTADSGAGAIYGDRKLRIFGIGPGASYTFKTNGMFVTLVAKFYHEFAAQSTTEGNAGSLSIRIKF